MELGPVPEWSRARRRNNEADKVQFQDIHFVRQVGQASPQLERASANGERFTKAALTTRTPAGTMSLTLENTMISGYTTSGTGTEPRVEQFNLAFSNLEMAYRSDEADGSAGGAITTVFDLTHTAQI